MGLKGGVVVVQMPREWDAVQYDSLPLPHLEWGKRVLDGLDLIGTEAVADVGCGTGRDTETILERLPRGSVYALDASSEMLKQFDRRIGDDPRVQSIRIDIGVPNKLDIAVDAIFSVAAFHWISDHRVLFENLSGIANRGCQLVFDCGGEGNIAEIRRAVDEVMGGDFAERPWNFAAPKATEALLEEVGFDVEVAQLSPSPIRIDEPATFERFLKFVVLGSQIDAIGHDKGDWLVSEVSKRLTSPVIDYVRLFVKAKKR